MYFVTYAIIAVTVVVSYLCFDNDQLRERLRHSPYAEHRGGGLYRLLTSGFVHADWVHLGINMFVFYSFGRFTEAELSGYGFIRDYGFGPELGPVIFLALYLSTIVIANLGTYFSQRDNPGYAAVGASGAVSGATFCFVLFLPWESIYLYAVLPIPSIVAGVLFLIYSQYADKRGGDNIDHSAHFFGALAMPALLLLLRPGLVAHFLEQLTQNNPW